VNYPEMKKESMKQQRRKGRERYRFGIEKAVKSPFCGTLGRSGEGTVLIAGGSSSLGEPSLSIELRYTSFWKGGGGVAAD